MLVFIAGRWEVWSEGLVTEESSDAEQNDQRWRNIQNQNKRPTPGGEEVKKVVCLKTGKAEGQTERDVYGKVSVQ